MKPVLVNGWLWTIDLVDDLDQSLIDRTGTRRLGTADPVNHRISIAESVKPPLLDKVVLHEIAHAITISHGLLDVPYASDMDEWAAMLIENHAIEAITLAKIALGRPICINGYCS